jgi:hypothetical protein
MRREDFRELCLNLFEWPNTIFYSITEETNKNKKDIIIIIIIKGGVSHCGDLLQSTVTSVSRRNWGKP